MPVPSVRPLFVVTVALALARPAASPAQDVTASAVALSAKHYLLDDPLVGGALQLRLPLPDGPFAVRLGAERLTATAERVGIPCAGLIPPGDACAPEPLRDAARLTNASGGVALRILGGRRGELSLTADLTLGSLRADTRAASGKTLAAQKWVWGGFFGAEAAWTPSPRLPLALEIGGALGGLMPVAREVIVDGYTPFDKGLDAARLRLGLAWRRDR
jgi:hypothetical protein